MLGDVGGFKEAVYFCCLMVVSSYSNHMYIAALIRDLFKVRLDTHGAELKELVRAKTTNRRRRFIKRKTADDIMLDDLSSF